MILGLKEFTHQMLVFKDIVVRIFSIKSITPSWKKSPGDCNYGTIYLDKDERKHFPKPDEPLTFFYKDGNQLKKEDLSITVPMWNIYAKKLFPVFGNKNSLKFFRIDEKKYFIQ